MSKRAIEYGLLAIVLMVPLLINPYGHNQYPYPQIAFFRFATLLLLTVWLVDQINYRDFVGSPRKLLTSPLILPALLFASTQVLSMITSVDPYLSFWGSHIRVYGIYTILCYVIFFFLIILNLRTTKQLERLITIVLLTSLLVALYGVLQHSGIDPLFPKEDYSGRVISTMGNPIFLGAYLIMVVPLAFGRLLVSLRMLLGRGQLASSRRSMLLEVIGYSSLLLLQFMCLLYTKARGPWFGLLGGALLFGILIALRYKKKKLLFIIMAVGVIFVALLIALNLPNTPLAPLAKSPYLSRLVLTDQLAAGTGTGWVRLLIWQGTLELMKTRPNLGFMPDPLRLVRPLIGYGPDTTGIVFYQVYPPGLAYVEQREAIADRAHNELLDLVVTTGVLGLLAFLLLMGSFFYYGFSLLRRARSFKVQITLVALLSAMFAHLVEAQFGLLLSSVETLLWLFLGLVSVMYTSKAETVEWKNEASPDNGNCLRSILSLLVVCVIPFFASFSNINFLLADVYTRQGLQFRNARQYAESITAHNRAIQVFPVESKLYQYKAAAYYELAQSISDDEREARGQLLQAGVDALAKALALQHLNPEYYADTGKLYAYWARMVDPGKYEQAVEFYERALQLAPRDAVYRNDLARVYFDAGRYEEAIQHLRLSLEIDPKFHATHYNLGLVYLKLGEKNKAEEHFETALLLDPGCEECIQQLKALESD